MDGLKPILIVYPGTGCYYTKHIFDNVDDLEQFLKDNISLILDPIREAMKQEEYEEKYKVSITYCPDHFWESEDFFLGV